jgi:hypothetical protein
MRLDSVEIKATIGRDQVDDAVEKLNLEPDRPPWSIYFCEDVVAAVSTGTPLLDAGVVLRARKRPGRDDATIKLRPCRRSQLTNHWLRAKEGDGWEFKVEADWAGPRRVLAASLTADRSQRVIAAVSAGERPVQDLFTAEQRDFLHDCAGVAINLDTLTTLPPVAASRWDPFAVQTGSSKLEIRAERWTVGPLDFLELSIVADADDAERDQAALTEYLQSLGFTPDANQDSKTRQVLHYLVEESRGPRPAAREETPRRFSPCPAATGGGEFGSDVRGSPAAEHGSLLRNHQPHFELTFLS